MDGIRQNIFIIPKYTNSNNSTNIKRELKKMRMNKITRERLINCKEDLKQRLQAKAHIWKRYTKRSNQYHQKRTFKDDTKEFYRELGKKNIQIVKPPYLQEAKKFLQEHEVELNKQAQWIIQQKQKLNTNGVGGIDSGVTEVQCD